MQLRMIYGSRRSEPNFLRTPRTKASSRSLAAPRAWLRAVFFSHLPPMLSLCFRPHPHRQLLPRSE